MLSDTGIKIVYANLSTCLTGTFFSFSLVVDAAIIYNELLEWQGSGIWRKYIPREVNLTFASIWFPFSYGIVPRKSQTVHMQSHTIDKWKTESLMTDWQNDKLIYSKQVWCVYYVFVNALCELRRARDNERMVRDNGIVSMALEALQRM